MTRSRGGRRGRRKLSLLTLDTGTGTPAERLYGRLGWTKTGIIPGYALNPDGTDCDTTIFWKGLADGRRYP